MQYDPQSIFSAIDLFGVFVGGVTGALVGRRLRYDITGLWGLALVSGLGGGLIRDTFLQDGPPLALIEPTYLPTVLVAALAVAVYGPRLGSLRRTITAADALALASFTVAGCLRSFDAGLGIWPAILLGVITAVGDGVIRDILTGDTPMVFRKGELYALAALGGCLVVVICRELGSPRTITSLAGMGTVLLLRFGSLRWGWTSWVPR
ncbi:MAG: trimeric intracellular cation channel family protein [Thermomicrobiales bacterium]